MGASRLARMERMTPTKHSLKDKPDGSDKWQPKAPRMTVDTSNYYPTNAPRG